MPQMAPMMWLILMMTMMLIMSFFTAYIYFFNKDLTSNINENMVEIKKMPWLW